MAKIIRTDKWDLQPNEYQLQYLSDTVVIYREYVRRLISIVNCHWKDVGRSQTKQRYVEQLFHKTKDNPNPKYGKFFGEGTKFYKFPSYLRRAAINDAIGHVSSFETRYRDWQTGSRKHKFVRPPRLNTVCGVYPDLYKNQCIKVAKNLASAAIKVYKMQDWKWEKIKISSLAKRHLIPSVKQLSPTLVVKDGRASLSVPYEIPDKSPEKRTYDETSPFGKQAGEVSSPVLSSTNRYCGVDIGLNTTAVCSIVSQSGEVFAREFIHEGKSLDKRDKHLARIRKKAALTKKLHKGFCRKHYRKAANINKNIAYTTAKQIVNFAITNNATTIVIENLRNWKPKGGKRKSNLKQRFHGWVKCAIADRLEQLGQEYGIKIVAVYARGTSSFAYDGTGAVKRNKRNYAISKFQTGKIYSADLSASYNIVARYIAYKLKLASKGGKLFSSKSSGNNPGSWVSLSSLWVKSMGGDKPDTTTTPLAVSR